MVTLNRRRAASLAFFILCFIYLLWPSTDPTRKRKKPLDQEWLGFQDEEAPEDLINVGVVPPGVWPKVTDGRLAWSDTNLPLTGIVQHETGWTIFDSLYSHNGTWIIVTDTPEDFPSIREMISTGAAVHEGQEDAVTEPDRAEPTDRDMRIMSPQEAIQLFGAYTTSVAGVSFVANDPEQYLGTYFHFCAETLFGLWKAYSSGDPWISVSGDTRLPTPARLITPHLPYGRWRDEFKMNHAVLRASFPSMAIESMQDWRDRALTQRLFLYDYVVLTDRTAVMRDPTYAVDDRIGAIAERIRGSRNWWAPIRNNMLDFAGLPRKANGVIEKESQMVITYIIRQGRGRGLDVMSHRRITEMLKNLEEDYGWEVNILNFDRIPKLDQVKIAGRSTILIGVHGKGLTNLIWMQPGTRSTVIELFHSGGFNPDYIVPARMLGIEHYGVWDDQFWRSNGGDVPPRGEPEGFDRNRILVNATVLAELIIERMLEPNTKSQGLSFKAKPQEGLAEEARIEDPDEGAEDYDTTRPRLVAQKAPMVPPVVDGPPGLRAEVGPRVLHAGGDQPRIIHAGDQPRILHAGEQLGVLQGGDQPRVLRAGEQPQDAGEVRVPRGGGPPQRVINEGDQMDKIFQGRDPPLLGGREKAAEAPEVLRAADLFGGQS